MKAKISIAQIRTVTGDLEGNTNRIIAGIERAVFENVDIVLFPETAITGYACSSLFTQHKFIEYNIDFLERVIVPIVPNNLVVIVGFVDKNGTRRDGTPEIFNSCAVIQNKKIVGTYNKIHLADLGHHDDKHYFSVGDFPRVFDVDIKGEKLKIGCAICEDFWAPKDHYRDIVKECIDLLLIIPIWIFHYL